MWNYPPSRDGSSPWERIGAEVLERDRLRREALQHQVPTLEGQDELPKNHFFNNYPGPRRVRSSTPEIPEWKKREDLEDRARWAREKIQREEERHRAQAKEVIIEKRREDARLTVAWEWRQEELKEKRKEEEKKKEEQREKDCREEWRREGEEYRRQKRECRKEEQREEQRWQERARAAREKQKREQQEEREEHQHQERARRDNRHREEQRQEEKKREQAQPKDEKAKREQAAKKQPKTDPTKVYQSWCKDCDEFFAKQTPTAESFPRIPSQKCSHARCTKADKLGVCEHDFQRLLKGNAEYSVEFLRKERLRWHPDKFAGTGDAQDLTKEIFQLIQCMLDN